jgi:23S rRNA (guanosine2251-2'-O)-methyltransferase
MGPSGDYAQRRAFFQRYITVYGRLAVREALQDRELHCHRLHLSESNRPDRKLAELERLAQERGIEILHHSRDALSRISRNRRQDQGVALDVLCPAFSALDEALAQLDSDRPTRLFAFDGVTNPQNIGMSLRSLVAAGADGILYADQGNPALGPLVIKASAGVVFRAPLLRCQRLVDALGALAARGFDLYLLRAGAGLSLADHRPTRGSVYVLGGESAGHSPEVMALPHEALSLPMANAVESLNVAVAAALVGYATAGYFDR